MLSKYGIIKTSKRQFLNFVCRCIVIYTKSVENFVCIYTLALVFGPASLSPTLSSSLSLATAVASILLKFSIYRVYPIEIHANFVVDLNGNMRFASSWAKAHDHFTSHDTIQNLYIQRETFSAFANIINESRIRTASVVIPMPPPPSMDID